MGTPEPIDQPHKMEIVIRFNALTSEFQLTGCDKNPVVALGMLDYALSRVRRHLVTQDVLNEVHQMPRIALPGGPLS